jgi:ankyrin repeat protein
VAPNIFVNDLEDGMGRMAIHFAAAQSLEHFELILDAGANVEVRDNMGRTALHCATLGSLIDVVERVISLSKGLVDQADNDGWTPLLWAARAVGTDYNSATSNTKGEIITLLLDRGADPCIKWKGLDREWSPVKVASYHGADNAVV